ncbi:MAG: glycosyltransferase [Cyanobacteria bacterium P01_F01_bin.53]
MNPEVKTVWLRESFPWMGGHSGYELVCDTVAGLRPGKCQNVYKLPLPYPCLTKKLLRPITRRVKQSPTYDDTSTKAELDALWRIFSSKAGLVHTVYVERGLGLLPDWKNRLSFNLVGTAHQPAGLWRLGRHDPASLKGLDALIVLSSREVSYFEEYLPNRVHFIPHGVDLDFFSPEKHILSGGQSPRFVFCGTWLRDLSTLADVIDALLLKNPSIKFDMVVPASKRGNPEFYRISRHAQVTWHGGISNEDLRGLYRRATGLLLPLIDCTANNALLEAIACGVPVVSNDVGGIPDYTDDSFAELLPVGDVSGMVEAVLRLIEDKPYQRQRGVAARQFAEKNLRWDDIAARTMQVYESVLNGTSLKAADLRQKSLSETALS